MNSEAVAPGETLITHVALVASSKTPLISHHRPMKSHTFEEKVNTFHFSPFYLMLSFMVKLHGAQGTRGEATARKVTVKRWFTAVGIKVFPQVDQILTPWREEKEKRRALVEHATQCKPLPLVCFLSR